MTKRRVGAELSSYTDAGTFALFASSGAAGIEEVVDRFGAAFDDLLAGAIDPSEVERARRSLVTDLLLGADEPLGRLGTLGADLLLRGSPRSIDERVHQVEAVSVDDVRDAARRLGAAPRHGVLVGPVPDRAARRLGDVVSR